MSKFVAHHVTKMWFSKIFLLWITVPLKSKLPPSLDLLWNSVGRSQKTYLWKPGFSEIFSLKEGYFLNASEDFGTLFHRRKGTVILIGLPTWTPFWFFQRRGRAQSCAFCLFHFFRSSIHEETRGMLGIRLSNAMLLSWHCNEKVYDRMKNILPSVFDINYSLT